MLQQVVVKRIERIYRLRLIYGLHLALYCALMIGFALSSNPAQMLISLLWLPLFLAHTTAQTLLELREQCLVSAPVPLRPFNHRALPVDVYDEDGNRIAGEREHLLPG